MLGMCHLQVPGAAVASPDHLQGLAEAMSAEHVLSGSRRATAQAVAAAIACNMPVLLEGPAALGKTSLVTAIAHFIPPQQVLERVNNTESTGLQVRCWEACHGDPATTTEGCALLLYRQWHSTALACPCCYRLCSVLVHA
jgi:hypothetical protein